MDETWSQGRLCLRIPDGRQVQVAPGAADHALLGRCDAVLVDGVVVARCQAVDWERPAYIPPLDRPGALPEGAGTAILNYLATRATAPLRYHGPYPTGALFDSLLECFRVDDPNAAFARFTAEVEETALAGTVREVPVDFAPAPFRRFFGAPGVCLQMRDGMDKLYIQGRGYARWTTGARRVLPRGPSWVAAIVLGNKQWAEVATVSADGAVLEGPRPLPPAPAAVCGQPLPEGVCAALRAALPPRAPVLLRPALARVLAHASLRWEDTGDEAATVHDAHIGVHAAHLALFADAPPLDLLDAIARAVEPAAHRLAQQILYRELTEG